jgi:hypothetical protein
MGAETGSFATACFVLSRGGAKSRPSGRSNHARKPKSRNPEGRDAIVYLLRQATKNTSRRYYLYVNNRFEGSAPWTIVAALREAVAFEKPSG